MRVLKLFLILIIFLIPGINSVNAQMKRERAELNGSVEETFWAPNIVGLSTVETLPKNNLNVTIMHSFGNLSNRTFKNFFGLDTPPNVRLGLDIGLTNRWSLGIGRTTYEKVVDLRSKMGLIKQSQSGSVPVSLTLKGDLGITTQENNHPVGDDINFLFSGILARKLDKLSLQLAPMYAQFNTGSSLTGDQESLIALGMGGEYHINDRYALSAEYYPVLGDRNTGTKNAFALALNIETGGHVFQLFFASSNWHTEQYIIARNTDQFWSGDFRFGFNVNRVFLLGKKLKQ